MIKDVELIKQICVKDFDHFTDHKIFVQDESDPLWGQNLFSLKGIFCSDIFIVFLLFNSFLFCLNLNISQVKSGMKCGQL